MKSTILPSVCRAPPETATSDFQILRRREYAIRCESDVVVVRYDARRMAGQIGFEAVPCVEIETAVSELAFNLIRHVQGGRMTLQEVLCSNRHGIAVGCRNGVARLPDDPSKARGLGIGLAMVSRFMDDVVMLPGKEGGCLMARKWKRMMSHQSDVREGLGSDAPDGAVTGTPRDWQTGSLTGSVFSRPIAGESVCGDHYLVKAISPQRALIGLVDGLGHGSDAAAISRRVVEALMAAEPSTPLRALMTVAHESIRGSRGAALSLLLWEGEKGSIYHAGIGNVQARIVSDRVYRTVSANGILGHHTLRVREEVFPYRPGDLILMHTDGISNRMELETIPGIRFMTTALIATFLMDRFGSQDDDATILVAK